MRRVSCAEHLSWVLWLVMPLAACALPPSDGESFGLHSRTYGFIDELGRAGSGSGQRVEATLLLPQDSRPPWPAVVVLHSSIGQGTQDWHYARLLAAHGFAALAVDSFGSRDVEKTVEDQTLVSTASMLADAYAALKALAEDPRVVPDRIAVLGFSKGGIAALYAGLESVRERVAGDGPRFAAHVAYYPWCGVRFLDPRTTGAPILLHLGGRDEVAPAALCRDLIAEIREVDPAARISISTHPEARHAFDHPLLEWIGALPVSGPVPVDCRFREIAPGRFLETTSGQPASAANLPALFEACGHSGLIAGGDSEAAEQAQGETLGFLARILARSSASGE